MKLRWLHPFIIATLFYPNGCDHIIVRTNNGALLGNQLYVAGKNVYEFLGIPFAQPPVGNLRFRNPKKLIPWKHIYNATKHPPPCFQPGHNSNALDAASRVWIPRGIPNEDCLYLNLWTRAGNHSLSDVDATPPVMLESSALFGPKTGRPVMVWIHGGSLKSGSIDLEIYNGAILASMMNVVIVTVQYRLGPYGFLYLGTDDAPGNQGLMDQVLALEWIRDNVAYFGGNPQQITLFGHSGGVVSVALHLLSPISNKLFQQVILQSGSPLAWWAVESTRTAREKALLLADKGGCRVHTGKEPQSNELARCLRSLDAAIIQGHVEDVLEEYNLTRIAQLEQFHLKLDNYLLNDLPGPGYFYDILFKPVVMTPLLPDWPYELLGSGKLEIKHRVMLGVNKDEGLFHLVENSRFPFKNVEGTPQIPKVLESESSSVDPIKLLALYFMNENFFHPILLHATAFEYLLPSRSLGYSHWNAHEVLMAFNELGGDYNIKCPVVEFADFYSRGSNAQVFLYSFEHRTEAMNWPSWTGVMQGFEAEYIFGAPFNANFQHAFYNFTEEERMLSLEMMRFWTNFASTGSPNLNPGEFHTRNKELFWERYSTQSPITQDNYRIESERRKSTRMVQDTARKHMVFTLPHSHMMTNLRRHQCMFWREQLPLLREQVVHDQRCPNADKMTYVPRHMTPAPGRSSNIFPFHSHNNAIIGTNRDITFASLLIILLRLL